MTDFPPFSVYRIAVVINWSSFCFIFLSRMSYSATESAATASDHHVMLINQSKVAYGGILKEATSSETVNAFEATVIKCAIQSAIKRHPATIPTDSNGKTLEPQVSNFQKLKLQATHDGQNRSYLVDRTLVNGKEQFHRRSIIYGITYSFCLLWDSIDDPIRHNFVMSLDRGKNMFMFQHTFYRIRDASFSNESSRNHKDSKMIAVPTSPDELSVVYEFNEETSSSTEHECPESKLQPRSGESSGESHLYKRSHQGRHDVSIVSYNIWNFNGFTRDIVRSAEEYVERMARLGALIKSTMADVIGFQEVRFDVNSGGSLGPCQVEQLANHLPEYQYVYQPAIAYEHDSLERKEEGLAIFSLHPILSHDFILLSRDMNDGHDSSHQRICLHAAVDTPYLGIVHVFVTHLSLSKAARDRSVVEIWKFMSRFNGPAVLLGDLNAEPQSNCIRFLRGEVEIDNVKTTRLQDAWLINNKEPRVGRKVYAKNEARDTGLTFNTLHENLVKRIDYVFVRLPEDMQMTSISLVDDGKRGNMAASDHLGLKVSIEGV
ncbi:uncharacterized protein [Asterias amurensis]|uniref:uncharacterized protein isoform X1 n=2 Tax=Asterias amurensis TaxID=7602 RepID=UPI003AB1A4FB